jgi:hypothetical protein
MESTRELIERRKYLEKKLSETRSKLNKKTKVETRSCWFEGDAKEMKKELESKGFFCELVYTNFGAKIIGYLDRNTEK